MHDLIVLGTGGVGSAAMYHAAQRGLKVLGLDRFPPAHDRGSSHGQTRIIRMSYFEHPDYVPLLRSSYQLWDQLGERIGQQLFHRTGLIYFGDPEGIVLRGLTTSAREHQLDVSAINQTECVQSFPGYACPEGAEAMFEPDAGYLLVEECIKAHLAEAVELGAEHRHGESVLSWRGDGEGYEVKTDQQAYRAARLIITAGCWAKDLLSELNVPLRVLRKHLHWYATDDASYRQSSGCPCFFFETGQGMFYGFPDIDGNGIKVAEHSGGMEIQNPLDDPREQDAGDTARIEQFLSNCMPGVSMNRSRHEVCFYTMTADENFIVDHHPEHAGVTFAAGLSGHGFKFASALGKTLVELAIDQRTSDDMRFLGLSRPGLKL